MRGIQNAGTKKIRWINCVLLSISGWTTMEPARVTFMINLQPSPMRKRLHLTGQLGATMGLETDIRKLRAKGFRPALLGGLAFLFIAGFSLVLIILVL